MQILEKIYFGKEEESSLIQWIDDQNFSKIFILCDEHTRVIIPKSLKKKADYIIRISSGEKHKDLKSCNRIWRQLVKSGCDRNSLLINFGGGVVTDMGSFAASVFMRGISFINIPTSLLAMVDASVGAKTGIDFYGLKNYLGTFNEANYTFINNEYLSSLPHKHILAGKAEMIKHGLIADYNHFQEIINLKSIPNLELIKKSVFIKSEIVNNDFNEKGLRKVLNYGHTLGHAIETWSITHQKDYLLHGEAVLLGIYLENELAASIGFLNEELKNEINDLIKPYLNKIDKKMSAKEVLHFALKDKKNQNGNLKFSLLKAVNDVQYDVSVSNDQVLKVLETSFSKLS